MTDKMRSEFEEWALPECFDLTAVGGFYSDNETDAAYKAWQACAARMVPEGWKLNRDGRWISITQPDGKGVRVRLNLEGHQDAAATLYRLADAMLSAAPEGKK